MRAIFSDAPFLRASMKIIAFTVVFGCWVTHRQTTLAGAPPSGRWETLPNMPGKLARFVLAQDGQRIYRLGGVSFNIRVGGAYSRAFSSYDPSTKKWTTLPPAPFGTGCAFLEYWPERNQFLAIAGIARLGDAFDTDGATVGIFDPVMRAWRVKRYRHKGLGRLSCVAHAEKSRFLLLAHDKAAILDVDRATIRLVGRYPVTGRTMGAARIGRTLFVLQGDSRESCRLHKFDAGSGAYLGDVDISDNFLWPDKIFAWREQLVVWENSSHEERCTYTHSSRLLRIDPKTGASFELHPNYPGPRARRSADAVVLGDSLYAFGGQRRDSEWLQDAYAYHFLPKNPY